jgi:chromosome segregation ATPase
MSLLAIVYYTNAASVQNKANAEIADLQVQNANLRQQVNSLNSQVTDLNTELSNRNDQITTLGTQNERLSGQVDYWTGLTDDTASQLSQMETPSIPAYTRGGGFGKASSN